MSDAILNDQSPDTVPHRRTTRPSRLWKIVPRIGGSERDRFNPRHWAESSAAASRSNMAANLDDREFINRVWKEPASNLPPMRPCPRTIKRVCCFWTTFAAKTQILWRIRGPTPC